MNAPSILSISDAIILLKGKIEIARKQHSYARPSSFMDEGFKAWDEALDNIIAEQAALNYLYDIAYYEISNGASEEAVVSSLQSRAHDAIGHYATLENEGHTLAPDQKTREAFLSSVMSAIVMNDSSYIKLQSV